MSGSYRALVALVLAAALAGCNKKEETEAAPVQNTDPPMPTPAPTPGAGGGAAANPIPPTPATPIPPSPNPAPPQPGSRPPKLPDAGLPTFPDAGPQATPDAGAPPADAGPGTGGSRAQACFQRCSAVLQSCLVPSLNDAGIPTVKDPAACNAVAEECRKACQP